MNNFYIGEFRDYNEIEFFAEDYNKIFKPSYSKRLKCFELGCTGSMYVGVFYFGRKPKLSDVYKVFPKDDLNDY